MHLSTHKKPLSEKRDTLQNGSAKFPATDTRGVALQALPFCHETPTHPQCALHPVATNHVATSYSSSGIVQRRYSLCLPSDSCELFYIPRSPAIIFRLEF
jgi:hypothetical protein